VAKWKDLALRNAAELDNYRKRVARDMQDTRAYANTDLLRDLLPILDNFEMGLDAAKAESEKSMIYIGLSMVRRQLADFLRDVGVEEVPGQGAAFDPNVHEAVSHEPSTDQPEGTILKVMRRGFKLKDRLLRASTVAVSSGPPAA
jgi:molecular chaperone GrpE